MTSPSPTSQTLPTAPSSPEGRTAAALQAFEQLVQNTPGFRLRDGQRAMAQAIAEGLSDTDLGESAAPQKSVVVIQAGTGVGKSAAYLSTVVAMALERKTRVLLSTATVALQEQLMQKDLPALARTLDQPFNFALAKGRGRYVCVVKLDRQLTQGASEDDFFGNDTSSALPADLERRALLYSQMQNQLTSGSWDGDRDTLTDAAEGPDWSAVAAERHTCTARHCPRFRDCSYYQARTRLTEAQVIVANHDLVLASLGKKTLPELDNCMVVFDEGHHLPAVALDQFSSSMDLSYVRWLDRLPKAMQDVRNRLHQSPDEAIATVSAQLKVALNQGAALVLDLVHAQTGGIDGTLRFPHGVLPDTLSEPLAQILAQAQGLSRALDALGTEVKTLARDDPSMAAQCAQWYASLGVFAPRLSSLSNTAALLLEQGAQPLAKWLTVSTEGGFLNLGAHACPMVAADLLRQFVWSQARAALITSASLTSCGSFDYFLREAGLVGLPHVRTLEVSSPFDYARQGTLTVVHTAADPKDVSSYTTQMVQALQQDLRSVQHGALVLFTSRSQMRAATDALDAQLTTQVLVQGSMSRARLLAAHTARVEAGLPSILFGMQSFGEGLDLPGALCETVFITKLPFAPPSAPVDEARAEWLRSMGRDPFSELVIPATSVKLLQWTGRAIRSESDQAHVVCYDKRLQTQAYGRRLLNGLPPYPVLQRSVARPL